MQIPKLKFKSEYYLGINIGFFVKNANIGNPTFISKKMAIRFLTPITAVVRDGFLSLMKGSSLTARSPFPSVFFGLGVTIKAAKPAVILPIGDDGSLYKNCSSGELIVNKNQ
jgi:hypothetical protein